MEKLGIEPIQLLTQVFNFAVMVFLLGKFLYKPILQGLEKRRQKIAEGLEYAAKMQEERELNEKKREEIIKKAKVEAQKIIEESKKIGRQVEADLTEKAQKETNAILAKAREELVMEKSEMERELRVQTVELAKTWVEAVLRETLGTKSQQTIINKKIADISKL